LADNLSLFHPAEVVATPTQTFAGMAADQMRRKKRIGEDAYYVLSE
jgi:hypothetical protein